MIPRAAILLLAALAGAAPAQASEKASAMEGRVTVQRRCIGCHNAGVTGRSVYTAAPPFRTLGGRHTPESLRRTLGEPSPAGHYGMPVLSLTPAEAADVIAYIEALSTGDRKTRRRLALPPGAVIR